MATRAKFDTPPEFVRPKLIEYKLIPYSELQPSETPSGYIPPISSIGSSNKDKSDSGFEWTSFTLSFSLLNIRELVKTVNEFLEFYNKILGVIVQILKVIRLFSGLSKSIAIFIKFIIGTLAQALKELIDSLASTGLYMCILMDKRNEGQFAFGGSQTLGGFRELISRVNHVCSNSLDPDAPRFDNPKDKVGGVIIAAVAGSDNPDILKDLSDSIDKLGKLFGFGRVYPDPAKNFKAKSGFYKDFSDKNSSGKKIGVSLTWEDPDSHVNGFVIYRTKNPKGNPQEQDIMGSKVKDVYYVPGEQIAYVKGVLGKVLYRYTDFSVEEGVQYYYKVYSVYNKDWLKNNPRLASIDSPVSTRYATAKCVKCIPVSELSKYTVQKLNGDFIDALTDWRSDWQSFTVRTILSKQLDLVFSRIDLIADWLVAQVNTSSSVLSKYINNYEKKFKKILNIMTIIEQIIEMLMSLTLKGSFFVLTLDIEEGGMAGFLERFNKASRLDTVTNENRPLDNPFEVSKGGGIMQFADSGVYFGLILLFGFPVLDGERLKELVPPSNTGTLKTQITATQKAVETLLKLLGLGG